MNIRTGRPSLHLQDTTRSHVVAAVVDIQLCEVTTGYEVGSWNLERTKMHCSTDPRSADISSRTHNATCPPPNKHATTWYGRAVSRTTTTTWHDIWFDTDNAAHLKWRAGVGRRSVSPLLVLVTRHSLFPTATAVTPKQPHQTDEVRALCRHLCTNGCTVLSNSMKTI